MTNCELIPDQLQNGGLVAEVLKNRPDCSLNFSVTYRRVPIQDVTRRHIQEVGNILPHHGADVRTCTNTFLPSFTVSLRLLHIFCEIYPSGSQKAPILPQTHIYEYFCSILTKIMPAGTLILILPLKRFFLQIMCTLLTITVFFDR